LFIHLPGPSPPDTGKFDPLCRMPDYAALSFDFPAVVERVASAMRHNPVT
jgi:hypothetical protein